MSDDAAAQTGDGASAASTTAEPSTGEAPSPAVEPGSTPNTPASGGSAAQTTDESSCVQTSSNKRKMGGPFL